MGSRSLKLQASREPDKASVSKEHFACFLLLAQKALWWSSILRFLLCFIFDNPWPVRFFRGSYNWIVFVRQSPLVKGKICFLLYISVDTIRALGLSSIFRFWPRPQVKNWFWPEVCRLLFICFVFNNNNSTCPTWVQVSTVLGYGITVLTTISATYSTLSLLLTSCALWVYSDSLIAWPCPDIFYSGSC